MMIELVQFKLDFGRRIRLLRTYDKLPDIPTLDKRLRAERE